MFGGLLYCIQEQQFNSLKISCYKFLPGIIIKIANLQQNDTGNVDIQLYVGIAQSSVL